MAFEFEFPDVGEGITEGEIVKWLVKVGDTVKEDDPIAEIETDKAVVEVPAPRAGTILKLFGKEGDIIEVGSPLAVFGDKGEKVEDAKPAAKEEKPAAKTEAPKATEVKTATPEKKSASTEILVTPAVRKLAEELGVDLISITGTGSGGRITEQDVAKGVGGKKEKAATPAQHFDGKGKRVPLRGVRKAVAKHMRTSVDNAVHVAVMEEIDVTDLWDVRKKEKENAKKKGAHLTFLPFIIKATIEGLKKHPYLNSSLDGEEIVLKEEYHIGVAVDTEEGLLVPVVRDADKKNMIELAKEITELAEKARTRKASLEELKGSTFTITNYGSIGTIWGAPVINYPECAIMGLGRIQELPRVVDGKIVVRRILPVSISFDHRIVDGAEVARFLNVVKQHLEDPDLLLIEGK